MRNKEITPLFGGVLSLLRSVQVAHRHSVGRHNESCGGELIHAYDRVHLRSGCSRGKDDGAPFDTGFKGLAVCKIEDNGSTAIRDAYDGVLVCWHASAP